MKRQIRLAFTLTLLVVCKSVAGADKPLEAVKSTPPVSHASAKQVQFNLRLFEGNPLGSQEAGTLKVLAERLVALENRPFSFVYGGQIAVTKGEGVPFVQFDRRGEVCPGAVKGGKIRLDITLSNTTVEERTEDRIQFHTESVRTITTVRLGEVLKLRWGKGSDDRQVWVELSVAEVDPKQAETRSPGVGLRFQISGGAWWVPSVDTSAPWFAGSGLLLIDGRLHSLTEENQIATQKEEFERTYYYKRIELAIKKYESEMAVAEARLKMAVAEASQKFAEARLKIERFFQELEKRTGDKKLSIERLQTAEEVLKKWRGNWDKLERERAEQRLRDARKRIDQLIYLEGIRLAEKALRSTYDANTGQKHGSTLNADVKEPKIREEILARAKKEQDLRFKLIKEVPFIPTPEEGKKLNEVDTDNRIWLKAIIEKHGWPGKTLVGVDGAHMAWLMIQHANADLPLQKECLELLKAAVKQGEATGVDLAYLTDRVLSAEGKKQLYGTQLEQKEGKMVPRPVEYEANLDARRKELGMEPMAEYLKAAAKMYKLNEKRAPIKE